MNAKKRITKVAMKIDSKCGDWLKKNFCLPCHGISLQYHRPYRTLRSRRKADHGGSTKRKILDTKYHESNKRDDCKMLDKSDNIYNRFAKQPYPSFETNKLHFDIFNFSD